MYFIEAPTIQEMTTQNVENGTQLIFVCPAEPGIPANTTYIWTRTKDSLEWNTAELRFVVNLSDDDNYTCNAKNTMRPTGQPVVEGSASGVFHLNVQCKYTSKPG